MSVWQGMTLEQESPKIAPGLSLSAHPTSLAADVATLGQSVDRNPRAITLIDDLPLRLASMMNLLRKHVREPLLCCRTAAEFLARNEMLAATGAIVVNLCGRSVRDPKIETQLDSLRTGSEAPIIMVTDREDIGEAAAAFRRGVRGYVPTSLDPQLVVRVLRLIMAGGSFVPACILARRQDDAIPAASADPGERRDRGGQNWPPRQLAVLRLLVQGKANKEIARSLSMQESTVKVHVREIMRKLQAANRTEAALLAKTRVVG